MYFYVWGELLLSELPMELMERLINQVRECWYMGSMLARSAMEKNKMAECTAMGVYCSPCGSHRSSAPSPQPQPARLWFHWLAHRILTPVPSARIFPSRFCPQSPSVVWRKCKDNYAPWGNWNFISIVPESGVHYCTFCSLLPAGWEPVSLPPGRVFPVPLRSPAAGPGYLLGWSWRWEGWPKAHEEIQ